MGWMDSIRVRQALMKHQKGQVEEARDMYAALFKENIFFASYLLPYSVLLLREGKYELVKQVLLKANQAKDLTEERRPQLLMNFAVAQWMLGDREAAIEKLEQTHKKYPCGLIYQTLGYLYVESGNVEKAKAYLAEGLAYDEEDSIVLDNMGQLYYRLLNDPEGAYPYFKKAHRIAPEQIDTLYFLSRYDLVQQRYAEAADKLTEALKGRFSPLNYCTREQLEREVAAIREKEANHA